MTRPDAQAERGRQASRLPVIRNYGLDEKTGKAVLRVVFLHAGALTFHAPRADGQQRTGCGRTLNTYFFSASFEIVLLHAIQFARPCGKCFPSGIEIDNNIEWFPGWYGHLDPANPDRMVIR